MKLKTIASIFKKHKHLRILTMPNGAQWITNGYALYSMAGMPDLTPPLILKIFDIPEDKQPEWHCTVEEMSENIIGLCTDNYEIPAISLTQMKVSIEWCGSTYLLLSGGGDIFAVDEKFVKPLYDDIEYLRFYKRDMPDGSGIGIICYNALELIAVIMPFTPSDDFSDELKSAGLYFDSLRYRALAESLRKGQHKPNVDPETGEVLDEDSDYTQETL